MAEPERVIHNDFNQKNSNHNESIDLNKMPPEEIVVDEGQNVVEDGNESDSEVDNDVGNIPDNFIDINLWESIDKNIEDFNAEDMARLSIATLDQAIQFYKMYAKAKGFGVRHRSATLSTVDARPTAKTLLCNREGFRSQKHYNVPDRIYKPRAETRCGCMARIIFKWHYRTNNWYVWRFIEEHNHKLVAPTEVAFIRSHRHISDSDKMRIKSLINSGVPASITMRNFAQMAGDLREVGFLKKDLYNTCHKMKKEQIVDGDAETLMVYLSGKMSTDPTFFLRFTRDENNGVDKIFWCDGRCRNDYKAFGRVVAFDATYKINAYEKPFVVIVGVNHHRKTIPFAVALITNEKTETYAWVLKQLLEAGDNMVPYTVITDGDKAMASAIKEVFPNTRHRLCLWHLMRNIKGHTSRRFCSGFMKCVDRCRTPEDFEKAWNELVTHYKVSDKKWAKDLYDDKEKWAEAYMRGHFYAGMRSTQRCESMNSTLKTTLTKDLLLYQFVGEYDSVLHEIRFAEDRDNYNTVHSFPVIEGVLKAVKTHAAATYTRNAYAMLCKELEYESRYVVYGSKEDTRHVDGVVKTYWLSDCEWNDSKYVVVHSKKLEKMWCCCLKFESIGFPCRHMFTVMKVMAFKEIPAGNILRRWTMRAKEHCASSFSGLERLDKDDEKAASGRFAYLNTVSIQLCRIAASSYQRSMWLKDRFAKLILETEKDMVIKKPEKVGVNDPKVVKERGKPRKKRGRVSTSTPETSQHGGKTPNSTGQVETTYTLGADNGILSVLKTMAPETYTVGEASSGEECYEVSAFEKIPVVFDWDPKPVY